MIPPRKTQKKKESLNSSTDKYFKLFKTLPYGITYHDKDGKITDANITALQILETSLTEIRGKNPYFSEQKYINEDFSEFPLKNFPCAKVLETGKPDMNKIVGFLNPNTNTVKWIKIDCFPLFEHNSKKPTQLYTVLSDITITKQNEFVFKENEKKHQKAQEIEEESLGLEKRNSFASLMTENHPAGVVACDSTGKLVLFNKTAKKWHGVDILKTPQEKWAESYNLHNPKTNKLLETHEIPLLRAFNNEKVENIEMIINAKHQEPRYVLCNGATFLDKKGDKLGALVIMNDITDQKKKEQALRKKEKELKEQLAYVEQKKFFLKESAEIAKIGGWGIDLLTNEISWSDQVYKIHGLPIGQLPSLEEALDFFIEGSKEILQNAIQESMLENKKYDLELRFQNAQKEKMWVQTIGYPLTNKKGEVIGLRGVFQDITEKKLIREQIKETREIQAILSNNTSDIICLLEKDNTFKYITPSIENILGFKQEELIGKKAAELFKEKDFRILRKRITQSNNNGFTFKLKHKKGHFVWLEFLSTPVFKNNGTVNYIVVSAREITRWIIAKNKIERYQKSLQTLTKEITLVEEKQKREIASNIHDNLSQSLVISKMKVNHLQKNAATADIEDDLDFIASHITDALENSRKITFELSPPVLYQLGIIEAINWLLEKLGEKHKIKFILITDLFSTKLNETKSILIYRCIQEILANSIKYSKASKVTVHIKENKTNIIITIEDNGIGFNTNILNIHRFETQLGSGFGLFTIKERINNLNGIFIIESNLNAGTKATISIPLDNE